MNRVKNKVAIVTGAGSGIGAASAQALAAEGAKVVFADINLKAAQQLVEAARGQGQEADAIAVDVGDPASIQSMIEFAVKRFGGLDILHNNAADTRMSATQDAPVEKVPIEIWDAIMRINARGTMLGCKYAIPHMRARGGGSIINTASGSAHAGMLSQSAYGVSKAAIVTLTQYVATTRQREHSVQCNLAGSDRFAGHCRCHFEVGNGQDDVAAPSHASRGQARRHCVCRRLSCIRRIGIPDRTDAHGGWRHARSSTFLCGFESGIV